MADNITNITNSTNEVKASFDKMTSSMKNLVALQMAQLTKSSAEYASNIDDATNKFKKLFDLENRHIKKLKEANSLEEEKIKLEERLEKLKKMSLASDKAKEQIEKRIQDLKNKKLDKEEDLIKEINKLRKEGLDIDEKEIDSQEDLIKFLENRKGLLLRNVEITKEQSKELRRQYAIYKNHGALAAALNKKWVDIKKNINVSTAINKMSSLTRGWLTQLGTFASVGRILERSKTAYSNYQDNMWGMGQSLKYANDGISKSIKLINSYDASMKRAASTAAKFGVDTDRVIDVMNQLSSKVLFLKKVVENGNLVNRYDYEKVEKMTGAMIAFARSMRMDISEAVDMYSSSIRKFGMSSESALGIMSEMQAQTISFNDMLGESAVFADEVGRAMLEIQQGTRYWVQDLMMMNTQFNAHINLLIKQGKSQKEALALAKSFQKITTEPTSELTKYNVGKSIKQKYHKAVEEAKGKGLSEEEQILAGAKSLGYTKEVYTSLTTGKNISKEEFNKLSEAEKEYYDKGYEYLSDAFKSKAETIFGATIKNKKFATEKGESDYFAEVGAEVSSGITGNIEYWLDRFNKTGWRLEVAQKQGFGQNLDEAAELERMLQEVKARGWDKEEGLNWDTVIRTIKSEDFDKMYGGLTEEGKASQKLIDSFNSLSDEEKKIYKGLTDEEKAKDYRNKEIEKSIMEMSKKKEDNRQFDALANINETNKDLKDSVLNQFNSVIKSLDSIENLLKIGVGVTVTKGLLSIGGKLAGLPAMTSALSKAKNLLTKNKVPKEVSGSVGNAVEKIKAKNIKSEPGKLNVDRRAIREQVKKEMPTANRKTREAEVQKRLLSKKPTITDASGIVSNVSKTGDKLGKNLLKRSPIGLGFAALDIGSNLAQGNVKGAAGSAVSTTASIIGGAIGSAIAPGIGTVLGSVAGGFIGDFIGDKVFGEDNTIDKDALFENFNKVTSSMDLLPENVDKAIEEYAKQSKDLSEDEIEKLKQSLRDSYSETYKEAQKSNTKNPEAILLRKKLEYGQLSQAELQQQQIEQEKEQYNKLDDLGKIISNQEKMFSLHDQWFSFVVETETRKLLDDRSLSKDQRRQRIKGMLGGAAGGRIKQAIDASNVTTWRVEGAGVSAAIQGKGMLD